MKKIIALIALLLAVTGSMAAQSPLQNLLGSRNIYTALKKGNYLALYFNGTTYYAKNDTIYTGGTGGSTDTSIVVMPWELGAYQVKITNITDTSKYIEYADTTASLVKQWRLGAYVLKTAVLDTANTNAVSQITAGNYITVEKHGKGYKINSTASGTAGADTGSVVMPWELGAYQTKINNLADTAKYVEASDVVDTTHTAAVSNVTAGTNVTVVKYGKTVRVSASSGTPDSTVFATILRASTIAHDTLAKNGVTVSGWTNGNAPMKPTDSTIVNGPSYGHAVAGDSLVSYDSLRAIVARIPAGTSYTDTSGSSAKIDSFTTTAVLDTVAWTGMRYYDKVVVGSLARSTVDTVNNNVLLAYPDTDRLIVIRKYGNSSAQKYTAIRYAGTAPSAPGGSLAVVDTLSSANGWTAAHTVSFTTTSTANYMLVFSSSPGTEASSGATYAGTAMTLLDSAYIASNLRIYAYGLKMPTVGTGNVVVNYAGSNARTMAIMTFSGVNQSTPTGTAARYANANSNTSGATVTSATGELVVDCFASTNAGAPTLTPGDGQTLRLSRSINSAYATIATSTKAGASSVTTSWGSSATTLTEQLTIPLKP